MTFNNEIEELKAQIQELQEKLQKLEEIEKQPRMNLQQEGKYAVVSYNGKTYYRLEGETTFSWYIKKGVSEYHIHYRSPNLVMVEDAETERLLEGLYYNYIQVKKEKEQRTKSPVEECYKDWWGQYPELETDGEFDVTRWHGFRAGYHFAYEENVSETPQERGERVHKEMEELVRESVKWCEEHPDESVEDYLRPKTPEQTEKSLKEAFVKAQQTEEWKETQRKIDAPKESWMNKSDEELVAMLEKNPPDCLKFVMGKTLEQIIERWWCDTFTGTHEKWSMEECIDDLIDQIELFLPRSQSSEGTQNIDTVVAVEAHNELLQKIKSKFRNKKDT